MLPRGHESASPPIPVEVTDRTEHFERAQVIALNYLSSMARTTREVDARLLRAEVDEQTRGQVLEWLTSYGYLDDDAFAHAWVTSRGNRKRLSRRALQSEMQRKGLDRDLVKEALDAEPPEAEEARARELAQDWVERLRRRGLDDKALAQRAAAAVMRRGFAPGLAFDAVRKAVEQSAGDERR